MSLGVGKSLFERGDRMLRRWKPIIAGVAISLTASCADAGNGSGAVQSERELEGFGGVALGATFEETMAVAPPQLFNPYGLSKCLEEIPMRGCFLSPRDELAAFRRIDGIPYGLNLEFNRFGALTDITLKFTRRRQYDGDLNPVAAKITKSECADLIERTIDWVTADYGSLAGDRPKEAGTRDAKTAKGNAYWVQNSDDGSGLMAIGALKMNRGRSVRVFAHFLVLDGEPDCDISVSFAEAEKVERRAFGSD